ncbi:hypothetical protein [Luteimonas notoginsengisoli]|uniref:Molybdopterin-binding protein n=1 Tax=Luteimonas notoginsengisoli TaxID=1578200 RepID=A0ABV7URN4_9GAMM
MATPRLLIAIANVLLLSACATGPARTQATAAGDDAPAEVASPADVTAVHDGHLHAAPPQAPALASPVVVPLDAASLAALPRDAVTANVQGETLKCEGVALAALMRAAGAMPAEPLHGAQLGRYVLVVGRGGDRVLFSLSEFDPTLGNRSAFVVDRCNGQQLDGTTGPLRLVVPDDARPERWVRQVQAITVIVAP